jgi:hypothetical protein
MVVDDRYCTGTDSREREAYIKTSRLSTYIDGRYIPVAERPI